MSIHTAGELADRLAASEQQEARLREQLAHERRMACAHRSELVRMYPKLCSLEAQHATDQEELRALRDVCRQ